ncbi:hypothetical protein [Desulfonatronum parangueonense]
MIDSVEISAISSLVMAFVWIIYLHLALVQYKRSNRPYMIIHYAHDDDPGALCLFVNMSKEPVHVQSVLAYIHGKNGYMRRYITDYERITPHDNNVQMRLRQGPIQAGGYLVLGSFEEILRGSKPNTDVHARIEELIRELGEIHSIEICVAVIHGPTKYHIGARRRFIVQDGEGNFAIRAQDLQTEQLVSWHKRKAVRQWILHHIEANQAGKIEELKIDEKQRVNGQAS